LDVHSQARTRALLAGLGAGLLLALSDCAATGLALLPGSLAWASLLLGATAGGVAGAVAALLRRPLLGPALVVAGGIGLEGLSIVSKELEGAARSLGTLLVIAAAAAGCAGVVRLPSGRARAWVIAGALATLPAGAYLAARATGEPWIHVAGAATPLFPLLLAHASAKKAASLALAFSSLALLAASWLERPPPPRPRSPPDAAPAAGGPNLVLLVIDTLRADAVDRRGELARFARGGVEFRQCVSAAPWTLPAMGSLLTGLVPSQHGALTERTPLADEVTTLAELLRARGYATAAFTGGAFVGTGHRLDQGFEHFDDACERRFSLHAHAPLVWRVAKNRYLPLRWLVRWVDEYLGFEGVVDAARAWGERRGRERDERPFFLLLHTYQVHDYYLYDPPGDDAEAAGGSELSHRFARRQSVHPGELSAATQADLDAFRKRYLARVRAVEARLPELDRWVATLAGEDVVWVITADHGEGFDAARGRVHHGGRLHEDLLRVPLVLRARGRLPAGVTVEESVRSVDVVPTVLDLLGAPIPPGLAGESLLPALRGERPFPAAAFAEERAHGAALLAVRRDGWKWIDGPGHGELYRLADDPLEAVRLPGEPPPELRAEFLSFPERFPARPTTVVELEDLLEPAALEHLRALGYAH
jgi:arylsulfatase A-like enzyme